MSFKGRTTVVDILSAVFSISASPGPEHGHWPRSHDGRKGQQGSRGYGQHDRQQRIVWWRQGRAYTQRRGQSVMHGWSYNSVMHESFNSELAK